MATILITDNDNGIINNEFQYLLGFQPTLGGILIKKTSVYIYLDNRYFDFTKNLNKKEILKKINKSNIYFKKIESKLIDDILIESSNSNSLKLEESLTLKYFTQINEKSSLGIYLNPKKTEIIKNYFEEKRTIKHKDEIIKIKKAIDIIENVFLKIEELNKSGELIGKTEKELRKFIIQNIINLGGNSESFDSIVAFGVNSAIPHHQTGDTIISNGPLLIDMGAKYEGYCSDFTRTIWVGEKNNDYDLFEKIKNIVVTAHNKAKQKIKTGMQASEIDKISRDYIRDNGYGEYFTHSTGHGVGLNIHEAPFINKISNEILQKGMVFTIEPGIYLNGKFGVRHENIFFV